MIVYVATNTVNGKQYVGCSSRRYIWHRKDAHFKAASLGRGGPTTFSAAIREFGRDAFSFEVIERCATMDKLRQREIYWIEKLNTLKPDGYNQNRGGSITPFRDQNREFVIDGKSYFGYAQLSDAFGIHELTIAVRIRRQGWTLRQALELDAPPPTEFSGNAVTFQGRTFISERQMCRHFNVTPILFRARFYQMGWPMGEALGVVPRKRRPSRAKEVVVEGRTFESRSAAARFYGINENSVKSRLNYGWSLEEALTTPLMFESTKGKGNDHGSSGEQ